MFNYKKLHQFDKVTENLLKFLTTAKVKFLLWRLPLRFMDVKLLRRKRRQRMPQRHQRKETLWFLMSRLQREKTFRSCRKVPSKSRFQPQVPRSTKKEQPNPPLWKRKLRRKPQQQGKRLKLCTRPQEQQLTTRSTSVTKRMPRRRIARSTERWFLDLIGEK